VIPLGTLDDISDKAIESFSKIDIFQLATKGIMARNHGRNR
jgi:hypothetical protein